MTIPAWFWPPSGAAARGIALVPYGSGLAVADWTLPALWPFSGGAFTSRQTIGSGSQGFSSAAPDASGGVWAITWDGVLWHAPYGGSPVSGAMPSGQAYVGAAHCTGSGFALSATGQVYTSAAALLGSFPLPARPLVASGNTLAAPMPSSGIGLMNATNGATGFIALPGGMTTVSCVALTAGDPLAVGGWANAAALSGAAAAAQDPQLATSMLAVGSGFALIWSAPDRYADAWSQTQAVTGLANLSAVAWRPDGTQALAASPTSGAVQVLDFTLGVLSLAQTLVLSGACSVAVTGDSIHALVAQSGQAQAATLTYSAGLWASGTPVGGLGGIVAVAPIGASGAVAAVSGGLQYLNLTAGVWASGATVPLSFVPVVLGLDAFNQVYAAGNGGIAMASGSTLVASGTYTGSGVPSAIAVQQGRIILRVSGDGQLRTFGYTAPGTLAQQTTTAISLGFPVGLALSTTTLFAMGSGGTMTFGFSGSPYVLTPVQSGLVGFWDGASWTTAGMGIGHLPAAIGLDASGGAWVATKQNTLWHIASGGSVLTSGTLQQYSGQTQTVPLCPSALIVASGATYVATSIPGVLEQVA